LIKQLLGKWSGSIKSPQGDTAIVFRFEKSAAGKSLAFLELANGAAKLPISKATLTDGKLSILIPGSGVEFKGKINGNKLEGSWVQNGNETPLTMTK
jgi:hypothetical protein